MESRLKNSKKKRMHKYNIRNKTVGSKETETK